MKYYIISGINQNFTMQATTLAEAEQEAKRFAEAYGLLDLTFVDDKNNKYTI